MKNLLNKKGFTLIELLVVIIILGILAGLAVPKVSAMILGSKINAATSNAQLISRVAKTVYAETNAVPTVALINAKLPSTLQVAATTATSTGGFAFVATTGYKYTLTLDVTNTSVGLASTDATTTNFSAKSAISGVSPTATAPNIIWTDVDSSN